MSIIGHVNVRHTGACVAGIVLLLASAPAGNAKGCSLATATHSAKKLQNVETWRELHQFYAACDDGGESEDTTEWVAHHLAHRWSWLPKLDLEIKKDPGFGAFVVRHIDSTADTDDLIEIRRTSAKLCPDGLNELCARLNKAAALALKP